MKRLHLERLEDRRPAAVAAFGLNFFDAECREVETVQVGQRFYAEITAREFDPSTAGLAAIALDIEWNPQVMRAIGVEVTDELPGQSGGTIDNMAGTIDDLAGVSVLYSGYGRPIGNWFAERFALLEFEATAPGESLLTMHEGRSRIVTSPTATFSSAELDFETQTITVEPFEDSAVGSTPTANVTSGGALGAESSIILDFDTLQCRMVE